MVLLFSIFETEVDSHTIEDTISTEHMAEVGYRGSAATPHMRESAAANGRRTSESSHEEVAGSYSDLFA